LRKEANKSRTIQSELLRMVEGFADGTRPRPNDSSNEWNLKGDGNNIEDWEFTNEAIKSLLRDHYNNQGNPFTQVKIDSRDQLGDYLHERDCAIIHTRDGHIFQKGIANHFGDFPDEDRKTIICLKSDKHEIIRQSGVTKHSSAEGVFLGAALFMEEDGIRKFLDIPSDVSTVLLPSHRRKFEGIQVEIDGMLIWVIDKETHIAIFEVKSDSRKIPNWDGGYSFHQVRNTAITVGARFNDETKENTTITPVYFRSEWQKSKEEWTMKLDLFEPIIDNNTIPRIISSLDIVGLPR
jgi:hypothetical protein